MGRSNWPLSRRSNISSFLGRNRRLKIRFREGQLRYFWQNPAEAQPRQQVAGHMHADIPPRLTNRRHPPESEPGLEDLAAEMGRRGRIPPPERIEAGIPFHLPVIVV